MSEKTSSPPDVAPSIYLDYGADEHDCTNQGFEICERGMRFSSHWQFALGTQWAVSFSYPDSSGETQRVNTEGIIVDCQQITCKCYTTTMLFLDLPESLRKVVRSSRESLEASVSNKGESRTLPHKASLN
jgi:hypothetical protein